MTRRSALEATALARISSPDSSTTPTAVPPSTRIRATGEDVRSTAPASVAAPAIAIDTAPVPPRGSPHDLKAPSISPM